MLEEKINNSVRDTAAPMELVIVFLRGRCRVGVFCGHGGCSVRGSNRGYDVCDKRMIVVLMMLVVWP